MTDYLEPWVELTDPSERTRFEEELRREVCQGHVLFDRSARALARRVDRDDVLFEISGGPTVAAVHLTYSRETLPDWPATEVFESLKEFEGQRMLDDQREYFCI